MKTYRTIAGPSEGLYKEKGSKFLSFAYTVSTEDEIKEKLQALKKEFFDARHHCYAYVLGHRNERYRANNDGEPNHSAGDPILGQIRSRNLTDVLVVVVRYFGGIKLGVSGLISAYRTAAADALDKASILELPITETLTLAFPYEKTSEVMRLLKEFDVAILRQDFSETCQLQGSVDAETAASLLHKLKLIPAVEASLPGVENQES